MLTMPGKIYVLVNHNGSEIQTVSLESLVLGQKMAEEAGFSVHALLLGKGIRRVAEKLSGKRLDSILLAEDDKLSEYDPDSHCEALKQIILQDLPRLLLMAHSYQNMDLAPKLAAASNRGLITDTVGYRRDGDAFIFIRQMFRNKMNAEVRLGSEYPWIVTFQAGAASADQTRGGQAEIVERSIDLSDVELRRRSLETYQAVKGKVDLSKAEIVVAVGRGIKKPENLQVIEDLARALGAEIGASRPVVDSEWLGRDRQIGSSGQTVSAKLYIACGISGAIQHIVGMKNSNCIVAINTDPNAPIFNLATYGIVGDLMEIVPLLTRKIEEHLKL